MTDSQRKRDEEAAEKYALAQQPDFDPSIYSESHEFKAKLRVYFELKWAYYAALKHCRDTEVKELKEKIENDAVEGYSIRPRIMHENDKEIYISQCNRIVQLRGQLRVAVEALEFYSKRDNWKFQSFSSDTKDVIEFSDMGCKSFNGENNYADYLCSSGGRRAREALQKIEAMKGGKDG